MKALSPSLFAPRWIILLLLAAFSMPSLAQNTKGDRPAVNNERKIRETKSKTVKRRDKAKTKDIAGRRLRTKDKSSANRANVGIRQPDPYLGRRRSTTDRAAKPRGRVYSEKPTEEPHLKRGDLAGYPIRSTKPRRTEAARTNVHPQSGPYVRFGSAGLTGDRPYKYKETASGRPILHRVPQQKERAWKGDLRGQPLSPPRSISDQRKNTFPQQNQYVKYLQKRVHKDKASSNRQEVARAQRLSHKPRTSGPGGGYISAGNKGFVKRGRKNVYWGKFSKGERPVTTDLTGAPLRKRNYRSPAAGLVGRDTLMYFGRRPHGDVSFAGERPETPGVKSSPSGKSWQGDISGRRIRRHGPSGDKVSPLRYPGYISATKSGGVGRPLPSAGINQSPGGDRVGRPIPSKGPGYGAVAVGKDIRRTRGAPSKGFTSQGEGFSGYIKAGPPLKGGGSVSGKLWNNNGNPIGAMNLPASAARPGRFSGHLKAGQKGYSDQGEEFTGYIKTKKPLKGGGSVSGKLWNNSNQPIQQRALSSDGRVGSYSGNIKSGGKIYSDQGEEFTGYIKAKKPAKGGGSVSGKLWNNNNTPTGHTILPGDAEKPGLFSGNIKASQKGYEDQGEEFTGYLKAKKPAKGGGSVSGKLWNNRETPITELSPGKSTLTASRFEGRSKGGDDKPSKAGFEGFGKTTVREHEKPTGGRIGSEGKVRLKEDYTQSPKAVEESTKKHKPERSGFQAEGLQIRVAKKDYDKREHTVRGALPGEGPLKGSIRASQFASGFRVTADHRRNPNSSDEALKGTYYGGRTTAQLGAFHGNVKVKKFEANRNLHPDAKFAHGPDNNDGEKTILTGVKLWWTKLFHDNSAQPANVKEKPRRPRYDKGEQGMWAE